MFVLNIAYRKGPSPRNGRGLERLRVGISMMLCGLVEVVDRSRKSLPAIPS
jgi:hypothetical protein